MDCRYQRVHAPHPRQCKKSFDATAALRGVSMGVGEGEVHALINENGAGKGTLLKVLSVAHKADAGRRARRCFS